MKNLIPSTAFFLALFAALPALAQTTTPTPDTTGPDLTWTNPLPGTLYNTNVIVISGEAKDTTSSGGTGTGGTGGTAVTASGIDRVEYRLSGGQWKRAQLVNPGANTTDFFASFKLGAGKSTRLSLRCFDVAGNESIGYTAIIKRSRVTRKYQTVVPQTTTTTTTTTTP